MQTKDLMTKNVKTVSSETSILEAAEILWENKFAGLPVVDSTNALVGIISRSDLVRFLKDWGQSNLPS